MANLPADPVITRELIRAIYHANEAMIARARELENTEEYKVSNSVGHTLRRQVEEDKQRFALLKDWIERHRGEAGLLEEEVRS